MILFLHGNGWRQGSPAEVHRLDQWAEARGMDFVSIPYRLYPEVTITTMISEVEASVRGAMTDASPVSLMGWSSGAHLAAVVGYKIGTSGIASIVAVDCPYYDADFVEERILRRKRFKFLFGSTAAEVCAVMPATYVNPTTAPPALLITSGKARMIAAADHFQATLYAKGAHVERIAQPGLGHDQVAEQIALDDTYGDRVWAFIERAASLSAPTLS